VPVYEFMCQDCHRKTSFFVRDISTPITPKCPFCGSTGLSRAILGFAYRKSLKTVWEESGEPTAHSGLDYYKDPRNIGRRAEKRFEEMGEAVPTSRSDTGGQRGRIA
jgi:putative FmdB family regulatory protein